MALGLDFSASEAKVERAFDHLKAIEAELPSDLEEAGPYSLSFSEVDPQTGWCSVYLVPKPKKPRFGVLLGDVVHNLRSALDYLVTTLAEASNASPDIKRGFPAYTKRAAFKGEVADRFNVPIPGGKLDGLKYGVGLIEQFQPYRCKPDPRADPVFAIHRLSNTDKHREISEMVAVPVGSLDIAFNGIPVDSDPVTEIQGWTPDQEMLIHRIRFDPPRAYNMRANGPLRVIVTFRVPAFRSEPVYAIDIRAVHKACERVRAMTDAFNLL